MTVSHLRRGASALALLATALLVTSAVAASTLAAQPKAKGGGTSAKSTATPLVGTWVGTATVPLPDSAIVVPVTYTFTQAGTVIGGMAMVPGQGAGPITNVVRDGASLKFRVTAPENRLLEHDVKIGADGTIEGMVNLNNQPIAKIKVTFKPAPSK